MLGAMLGVWYMLVRSQNTIHIMPEVYPSQKLHNNDTKILKLFICDFNSVPDLSNTSPVSVYVLTKSTRSFCCCFFCRNSIPYFTQEFLLEHPHCVPMPNVVLAENAMNFSTKCSIPLACFSNIRALAVIMWL